jgi:hypothetical protein
MAFDDLSDLRPGVHLLWVLVSIIIVIVLSLIKSQIDPPEQARPLFIRIDYDLVNVGYDGITKSESHIRIVKATGQMNCYLIVQGCSGYAHAGAPPLNVDFSQLRGEKWSLVRTNLIKPFQIG